MDVSYLAVFLGFRPLGSTHTLIHKDLLEEGEVFWLRKIWRLLLSKVEFHGTVVAKDVGEEGTSSQSLLTGFERHTKILPILRIGNFNFIPIKVLCLDKICILHKSKDVP